MKSTQKEPRAPYAFISYARRDQVFVDRLAVDLHRAGVRVWCDTEQILPPDTAPDQSSVPINPEQYLAATLSTFRDLKTFSGDLRTGFTGFSGLARIKVERKRNYRCH